MNRVIIMDNPNKFIPKKETKSSRTLRFPNELIAQMQEIAQAEDISFNQLVVQCCVYAMRHRPSSLSSDDVE